MSGENSATQPIRLVIADVDGTLVTKEKLLTPRAIAAVNQLRQADIAFTITSGRPPLGMKTLIQPLRLSEPLAAFNGGVFVRPDLSVLQQSFVPREVSEKVINTIISRGLDAWVYTDTEWLVRDPGAPHVAREQWTVKFPPKVTSDFGPYLDRVAKIVGVSDDLDAVAQCEAYVQMACGMAASAARSQPYYLDVTHTDANKGHVVTTLSNMLHIPAEQIATIGDMPNDVLMFEKSGVSIAMGQSSSQVQAAARFVTTSSEEEGFANAMEKFVLQQPAAASQAS